MNSSDTRSRLVVLVPDHLVNPAAGTMSHAAGLDDASNRILDVLIELGFGLVQLPPATLAPAKAARAIDFALDQLQDYAANGYRTLWLASGATEADTDLGLRVRDECVRRRFTALEVIDIGTVEPGDAVRIDPLLRIVAREPRPAPTASSQWSRVPPIEPFE